MVEVRQFMGGTYDTKDYPYVLLNTMSKKVYGRFSTLEKAHTGRLWQAKNNPNEIGLMLFNENTQKFIEWRPKELAAFEKAKQKMGYED